MGNLINDAGTNWPSSPRTHVWDAENRLQQVKVTATNASMGSYRYDAFHRRISKTTGTSTTWFLYDGWNLIAEYTGTTNTLPTLSRTHYWGLDLSGSMQGAGGVGGLLLTDFKTGPKAGVYFPLYDGNGNVTSYLDFNHTPVAAYRYDAFGKLIWGAYSHVADFNIGFSTKYRDPETDFDYYGYRYYSAALGRWLNRDPVGEAGAENLYISLDNDSINSTDLLGMVPQDTVGWENHHWFLVMRSKNGPSRGQAMVDRFCGGGFLNINDYTVTLAGNASGSPHKWLESPSGGDYNTEWRILYNTIDRTVSDDDKCCGLILGTAMLSAKSLAKMNSNAQSGDYDWLPNWPKNGYGMDGKRSPVKPNTANYHPYRGDRESESTLPKLAGLAGLACEACKRKQLLPQLMASLARELKYQPKSVALGRNPKFNGPLPHFNPPIPTPPMPAY